MNCLAAGRSMYTCAAASCAAASTSRHAASVDVDRMMKFLGVSHCDVNKESGWVSRRRPRWAGEARGSRRPPSFASPRGAPVTMRPKGEDYWAQRVLNADSKSRSHRMTGIRAKCDASSTPNKLMTPPHTPRRELRHPPSRKRRDATWTERAVVLSGTPPRRASECYCRRLAYLSVCLVAFARCNQACV